MDPHWFFALLGMAYRGAKGKQGHWVTSMYIKLCLKGNEGLKMYVQLRRGAQLLSTNYDIQLCQV